MDTLYPSQIPLFDEGAGPDAWSVGPALPKPELQDLATRLPDNLFLGTSSWSYPGWAGIVWDRRASETVLARDGLHAYAKHPLLGAAGVDRSYHSPPSIDVFRSYVRQVEESPRSFRFVVKAHRDCVLETDRAGAPNPRYLDPHYAVDTVIEPAREGLGSKLAAVLFQFPPNRFMSNRAARDFLRRLWAFLTKLPNTVRYAVEIRSPELLNDDYRRLLVATGVAHSYLSHPALPPIPMQAGTIPPEEMAFLLVRWLLNRNLKYEVARDLYAPFHRIVDPDPETRSQIVQAILPEIRRKKEVILLAGNKAEGSAPLTLELLAETLITTPA